jgi:threonine/homoserine/homoserine lactone efflux protein
MTGGMLGASLGHTVGDLVAHAAVWAAVGQVIRHAPAPFAALLVGGALVWLLAWRGKRRG